MATYVGFLRAINLGATRKFPKAAVIAAVEAAGFADVETYLNTGNVRFSTTMRSRAKIEKALEKAFEDSTGFEVPTIVFTARELVGIAEDAASYGHGGKHYVSLLKTAPTAAAIRRLEAASDVDELAKVGGRAVHLLLGGDYDTAKLTNAAVEKHLGVATNRNLTVLTKLAEMWGDV